MFTVLSMLFIYSWERYYASSGASHRRSSPKPDMRICLVGINCYFVAAFMVWKDKR